MLASIYPIGFFVSLVGLISWFYFQENQKYSSKMSRVFLGGFLVYLFSLAFAEGELSYKLFILFRDFMILASVSAGLNLLKRNKWVFVAGAALAFGAFQMFFLNTLQTTFPQKATATFSETIPAATLPLPYQDSFNKEGELLVEMKEDVNFQELAPFIDKYKLSYKRAFFPEKGAITDLDDYFVVNIPDEQSHKIAEILAALEKSPLVDYVEGNENVMTDPMEMTPVKKVKRKYEYNDPGVEQLWGFDEMNVDKLYTYLNTKKIKPKRKARIFILDTGVDATHEDLADNYKSVKKKYDKDGNGHGTHCAGIAAAISNNGKGVASLSVNNEFVEVSSVQVLASFGGGTQQGIIKGMLEAADKGADVISMSLGGRSNASRQKAYSKAVAYANKAGAIVIVAAGNDNITAKNYSPANADGVITVSAIDPDLNKASFSNTVDEVKMGIAAPGVSIYSTLPDNKYNSFNGTSMAAPYVSGLAGLLKSIKPSLETKELYKILHSTGKKLESGKTTGRLIQADLAVKALK